MNKKGLVIEKLLWSGMWLILIVSIGEYYIVFRCRE